MRDLMKSMLGMGMLGMSLKVEWGDTQVCPNLARGQI